MTSPHPLRPLAVEALEQVLCQRVRSETALTKVLRANPQLPNVDRAWLANAIHGVALWQGSFHHRLHHTLLDGAARIAPQDVPAMLDLLGTPPLQLPQDAVERLCLAASLPPWLAREWLSMFGLEQAAALAQATNQPGPTTLRANTLRTTVEDLATVLANAGVPTRRGVLAPNALHLEGRANLFGLQAWRDGLFEVQDEASQCVAQFCDVRPGHTVVDWCAGAGGKTLALSAIMGATGRIVALDIQGQRLMDLAGRLKRSGATNVETGLHGRAKVPNAHVVLVDAPCSSLGTLRRSPDRRWHLTPEEVASQPALQLGILEKACQHVLPGGRLIYATCTIHHAENDGVTTAFLAAHPEFLPVGPPTTLLPHVHGTDGFFMAAFQRQPAPVPA